MHDADEWYKTFFLVLSNLPLFLGAISALVRKKKKLMDAGFFFVCGSASVVYHFCQSGNLCLGEDIDRLRPADYTFVWTLGTWTLLRWQRFNYHITVTFTVFAFFLYTVLANYLIATVIFPGVLTAFFFVIFLMRAYTFHIPLYDFGLFFLILGLLFLGGGLIPFYFASDIYASDFWIWHSIWHFLSETGIWFVWEAVVGTRIFALIGLPWVYLRVDGYVAEWEDWEGNMFQTFRRSMLDAK